MAKIKIEKDLYQAAEQYALEKGYASVQELVTHLLERALTGQAEQDDQDQRAVEDRLKGLGYLE